MLLAHCLANVFDLFNYGSINVNIKNRSIYRFDNKKAYENFHIEIEI